MCFREMPTKYLDLGLMDIIPINNINKISLKKNLITIKKKTRIIFANYLFIQFL